MYGQVCSMHLNLFAYVSVVLSFFVLWISPGLRRLALRWWCHNDRHHHASIMGEEGLKEILLLRVYPSRFSGIPNRGTPPITMVCLLPRVHPGRALPPVPQSPTLFTPPARGGGAISFRSTARSKMKIKRFWFYTIFFHMRPHITPGSEPFNCAR